LLNLARASQFLEYPFVSVADVSSVGGLEGGKRLDNICKDHEESHSFWRELMCKKRTMLMPRL
jgi:hypothetical protein